MSMRNLLLFSVMAFFIALNSQAQVSYKITEADIESIPTWWVANSSASAWDYDFCEVEAVKDYYAVFTYNLTDSLKAWNWVTDLKVNLTGDDWDEIKTDLHIGLWINVLEGVNANDTMVIVFEVNGTNVDGGKLGWPNASFKAGPQNTWTWVSIDISDLQFSGNTPDMISGTDLGINLFKFSPQAKKDYAPQADKVFSYAIAEVVLSSGAYTPTTGPCGTTIGGGTSVPNVVASKASLAYPNPAKGLVNLKQVSSGKILDVTGKVVIRFNNTNSIDITSLPAGMYFIQTNNHIEKLMVK